MTALLAAATLDAFDVAPSSALLVPVCCRMHVEALARQGQVAQLPDSELVACLVVGPGRVVSSSLYRRGIGQMRRV